MFRLPSEPEPASERIMLQLCVREHQAPKFRQAQKPATSINTRPGLYPVPTRLIWSLKKLNLIWKTSWQNQSPIYSDINIPEAIHLASGPLSLNVQTIQILFSLSHHIPMPELNLMTVPVNSSAFGCLTPVAVFVSVSSYTRAVVQFLFQSQFNFRT